MANRLDYNRVMRKAWDGVSPEQDRNVHFNLARNYVRAMWKKHFNYPFPWKTIVETSGNRSTWYGRQNGKTVFRINCESGWHDINHDFTHLIERRKTGAGHSDSHLEIEREGAELIRRRFLQDNP